MISVCLAVPDALRAPAAYSFEVLALRWGLPLAFTEHADEATIVYAPDATQERAPGVHLRCDPRLYAAETRCSHARHFGVEVWGNADTVAKVTGDVVGSTYRLLTYLDESQVREDRRDRRGTFLCGALPDCRRAILAEPIVENHAALLLQQVLAQRPDLSKAVVPRWPYGKRWAIAVTHDADHVHIGSSGELMWSLLNSARRLDQTSLKLFRLGLRYRRKPCQNPYFMFPRWRKWESQRRIKSAFYLYLRPDGVPSDPNDCHSSVADTGTDWDRLRSMADSGWEFGLHPSIKTRCFPESFPSAKAYLESKLGLGVHGVRHHSLALDWRRPYVTHSAHARCGLRYDSSIAWMDEAGFRAGTCLPYRPFDPDGNATVPLLVIPLSLQDRHIIRWRSMVQERQYEAAVEAGLSIVDRVKNHGGSAVLDWHQESAFNELSYARHLDVLRAILKRVLEDSSAWIATPWEICQHWEALSNQIVLTSML
jgi:hypothetical protein